MRAEGIQKGVNCKAKVQIILCLNNPLIRVWRKYEKKNLNSIFFFVQYKLTVAQRTTQVIDTYRLYLIFQHQLVAPMKPWLSNYFTIHIDRYQRQRHPFKLSRRGSHFLQRANLIDVPGIAAAYQTRSHLTGGWFGIFIFMWVVCKLLGFERC